MFYNLDFASKDDTSAAEVIDRAASQYGFFTVVVPEYRRSHSRVDQVYRRFFEFLE
jgi:hypothetical protein